MFESKNHKLSVLDSPARLHIKGADEIDNGYLIRELGLTSYSLLHNDQQIVWDDLSKRRLYLFETIGWKHLYDDFSYYLYNNPSIRDRIQALGSKFDMLWCSVGDCDESFEYLYYNNGAKRRELIVDSPSYRDRVIRTSIGEPFKFESDLFDKPSEIDLLEDIERGFGIVQPNFKTTLVCYETENNLD